MPNPSYVPQPGSAGARAIAFLRGKHSGAEVSSAEMAAELNVTSSALGAYLASVIHHKMVTRESREQRVFWKLGPRAMAAEGERRAVLDWVGPPSGSAPAPNEDEVDHAPPIARSVPAAAAAPLAGVARQSWCPIAPEAEPEQEPPEDPPAPPPAAPPPLGLGWKAPTVPVFRADPPAAEEVLATATAPAAPSELVELQLRLEQVRAEAVARVVDDAYDPDFREVGPAPAPPEPEQPPPKGAEAAQAPVDNSCGRDDATPKDGVVPQGLDGGFRCALWSNGMLQLYTSEGELVLLNADDTRGLLRYIGDNLSARARAAA